jgi:penicillin-binding protein 2
VEVIPSELQRPETVFAALGQLVDEDPRALRERVGAPRGRARFQPVTLVDDLSFEELARLETHRFALPGVVTDVRPRRHYVQGPLAAHLLGSIGEISAAQLGAQRFAGYRSGDIVGQNGLEAVLERHLRGRPGGRNVVVDVAGREIEVLDEVRPLPGGTVVLALDLDLQRVAEAAFDEAAFAEAPADSPLRIGGVVALDPRNGDVLALVSRPAYDPNAFAGGIDAESWRRLTTDPWQPLHARVLQAHYPPGSTYKPMVAAAALEAGLITPQTRIFCPGHFVLGRRTFRCWKRGGHGSMDLHDAMVQSCDVFFYQTGLQLGIDRLAHFSRAFGLGRPTGIALGNEVAGLVPTSEWKERRFHERWVRGETVVSAIGQGFNLVTPVQLAVAYAALANGGRVLRPRLMLRLESRDGKVLETIEPRQEGELLIQEQHQALLRRALTDAVEHKKGTGTRARVPGVHVAGKTGTAQVVRLEHTEGLDEEEIPIRQRDHAWFAAFAPAEDPKIVVSVLVEHGGHGGSAAAPIAQRIMASYLEKHRETADGKPVREARLAPVSAGPERGHAAN